MQVQQLPLGFRNASDGGLIFELPTAGRWILGVFGLPFFLVGGIGVADVLRSISVVTVVFAVFPAAFAVLGAAMIASGLLGARASWRLHSGELIVTRALGPYEWTRVIHQQDISSIEVFEDEEATAASGRYRVAVRTRSGRKVAAPSFLTRSDADAYAHLFRTRVMRAR